jgi:Tfp pilus assembly protein PilO
MEKFLKNFQWFIILIGCYNLYTIFEENDPKPDLVRAEADKVRSKIAKNQKVKKDIDEFYKNIEEAKLKFQKVKESVEKTQQLLPTEISDIEYVKFLRQTAEDLNIKQMKIKPLNEEVNGLFISKGYEFTAKATYIQFLIFFEKVSNNKRVLNIKNVRLTKAEAVSRGKIQFISGAFILEAYRHNPNYKDTDAEKGLAPPPTPAIAVPKSSFLKINTLRSDG